MISTFFIQIYFIKNGFENIIFDETIIKLIMHTTANLNYEYDGA
jgi:hypothetical protein